MIQDIVKVYCKHFPKAPRYKCTTKSKKLYDLAINDGKIGFNLMPLLTQHKSIPTCLSSFTQKSCHFI